MVRPRLASIALGAVILLAACASGTGRNASVSDHPQGPAESRSPQSSNDPYDGLILRDGDTVRASGQVVSVPGKPVRFCTPAASDLMFHPITYCDNGIDVVGVNLHRLADRKTEHGSVQGNAQLSGMYRAGTLHVRTQGPPHFRSGVGNLYYDPPCPAPPGGWPRTGRNVNLDDGPAEAYRRAHPGTIMQIALSRPSVHQVLMFVLTLVPPAPVRRALRHDYPHQLCVTRSAYTKAEIHATYHVLAPDRPDAKAAGGWSIGQGLSRRGDVDVFVQLRQVTPAVADDAAAFPRGLVTLQPWLIPRR